MTNIRTLIVRWRYALAKMPTPVRMTQQNVRDELELVTSEPET